MRAILIILLTTIRTYSYSQSDTLISYLNKDLKLCVKEKAVYVNLEIQGKDTFTHKIYNLNSGSPVVIEQFTDYTCKVRNGIYLRYENGKEIGRGQHVNNIQEGLWLYWSDERLTDSIMFEHGKEVSHITFNYHINGLIKSRVLNNTKDNIVETSEYYQHGQLKSDGAWKNGTGQQTFYYPDGQLKTIEKYKKQKVISAEHYLPDGTKLSEKEYKKEQEKILEEYEREIERKYPSFPGGNSGFRSYFEKNFRAPKSLQEAVRNAIPVVITFFLDKEGKAFNISVEETFGLELRLAVEEVFKNMPAWNMKGFSQFGPIKYTISLNR